MMCRVKPDVVKDKETERNLQRIATRWDCFCPLKNRYTKALIVIHFWLDLILKLCLLRAKWFISKPAYLILNSTRDFTGLMRQEFNIISVYLVWTCCRSYCFCSHENSVIRRAFFLQWLSEFIAISDYFCYLTLYLGHNQLCITVALCCPFTLHFFFFIIGTKHLFDALWREHLSCYFKNLAVLLSGIICDFLVTYIIWVIFNPYGCSVVRER